MNSGRPCGAVVCSHPAVWLGRGYDGAGDLHGDNMYVLGLKGGSWLHCCLDPAHASGAPVRLAASLAGSSGGVDGEVA